MTEAFRYARHFARIYNRPLLIAPHALDALLPAIERVLRGGAEASTTLEQDDPRPQALVSRALTRSEETGLLMAEGGIALIPVQGVLVHRGGYDAECNYMLGYQDIARMGDAAMADSSVNQIALNIDTPGGEVAGAFDLARQIPEWAKQKPVHAVLNDLGLSSGYLLASAARSVSITSTGMAGSIGVVMRHVDFSEWLKNEGVTVTHIFAGARKIDGNPYEPLPDDVRERIQTEIDELYAMFVDAVTQNRGMTSDDARNTEADAFMGRHALERGLVDRIETPDEMLSRLADDSRGATFQAQAANRQETAMSTDTQAADQTAPKTFTQADLDAARVEGASAERERMLGILDHEEATERLAAAVNLARVEALTPDAAGKVLASMPKAKAGADNQFAAHMTDIGNPLVGPDAEEDDEPQAAGRLWSNVRQRAAN